MADDKTNHGQAGKDESENEVGVRPEGWSQSARVRISAVMAVVGVVTLGVAVGVVATSRTSAADDPGVVSAGQVIGQVPESTFSGEVTKTTTQTTNNNKTPYANAGETTTTQATRINANKSGETTTTQATRINANSSECAGEWYTPAGMSPIYFMTTSVGNQGTTNSTCNGGRALATRLCKTGGRWETPLIVDCGTNVATLIQAGALQGKSFEEKAARVNIVSTSKDLTADVINDVDSVLREAAAASETTTGEQLEQVLNIVENIQSNADGNSTNQNATRQLVETVITFALKQDLKNHNSTTVRGKSSVTHVIVPDLTLPSTFRDSSTSSAPTPVKMELSTSKEENQLSLEMPRNLFEESDVRVVALLSEDHKNLPPKPNAVEGDATGAIVSLAIGGSEGAKAVSQLEDYITITWNISEKTREAIEASNLTSARAFVVASPFFIDPVTGEYSDQGLSAAVDSLQPDLVHVHTDHLTSFVLFTDVTTREKVLQCVAGNQMRAGDGGHVISSDLFRQRCTEFADPVCVRYHLTFPYVPGDFPAQLSAEGEVGFCTSRSVISPFNICDSEVTRWYPAGATCDVTVCDTDLCNEFGVNLDECPPPPPDDFQLMPKCTVRQMADKASTCMETMAGTWPYSDVTSCRKDFDDTIACMMTMARECMNSSCPTIIEQMPIPIDIRVYLPIVESYMKDITGLDSILALMTGDGEIPLNTTDIDAYLNMFLCPTDRQLPAMIRDLESWLNITEVAPEIAISRLFADDQQLLDSFFCGDDILQTLAAIGLQLPRKVYTAVDHEALCGVVREFHEDYLEQWVGNCRKEKIWPFLQHILPRDLHFFLPLMMKAMDLLEELMIDMDLPNCDHVLPKPLYCDGGVAQYSMNGHHVMVDMHVNLACPVAAKCGKIVANFTDNETVPNLPVQGELGFCTTSPQGNVTCANVHAEVGLPNGTIVDCDRTLCDGDFCNDFLISDLSHCPRTPVHDIQVLPACTMKQVMEKGYGCFDHMLSRFPYSSNQTCKNNIDKAISCVRDLALKCLASPCPTLLENIREIRRFYPVIEFYLSNFTGGLEQLVAMIESNDTAVVEDLLLTHACPVERGIPGLLNDLMSQLNRSEVKTALDLNRLFDHNYDLVANFPCDADAPWKAAELAFNFPQLFFDATDHQQVCEAVTQLRDGLLNIWLSKCTKHKLQPFLTSILPSFMTSYLPVIQKAVDILEDFFMDAEFAGCKKIWQRPNYCISGVQTRTGSHVIKKEVALRPCWEKDHVCIKYDVTHQLNLTDVMTAEAVTEVGYCKHTETYNISCDGAISYLQLTDSAISCRASSCDTNYCNYFYSADASDCPTVADEDVQVLPQCSLQTLMDRGYSCMKLVIGDYPYSDSAVCRNNIEAAVKCAANLMLECVASPCPFILDSIPEIGQILPVAEVYIEGLRSSRDVITWVEETFNLDENSASEVDAYLTQVLCPTNRTVPLMLQQVLDAVDIKELEPHLSLAALFDNNTIVLDNFPCDVDIDVKQVVEWGLTMPGQFYGAETRPEFCSMINDFKDYLVRTWTTKCDITKISGLLSLLPPGIIPAQFIPHILTAADTLERFFLNVTIPNC